MMIDFYGKSVLINNAGVGDMRGVAPESFDMDTWNWIVKSGQAILGAFLALTARNIYVQIRGGHEAPASEPPPEPPMIATTIPTPVRGN